MERERDWLIPAVVITSLVAAITVTLKFVSGFPGTPSGSTSLTIAAAIVVVAAFVQFMIFLFRLWRSGEEHPVSAIVANAKPALLRFIPVAAGVLIMALFLYCITLLKSMIAALVPFWADAPLAAIDRALLIDGQAAAMALRPALTTLDIFYGLWHAVNLGGIIWVIHWKKRDNSRQIISFMLTWCLGIAASYYFSSAGPIFTGRYDPAIAPPMVRTSAQFLWDNYQQKRALIGGGISAFPSLHVAIAAWFAIALKDRGLPLIGLAYLATIFACSIILGWHYASDGVAGAAIALLSDRLARVWLSRKNASVAHFAQPISAPS